MEYIRNIHGYDIQNMDVFYGTTYAHRQWYGIREMELYKIRMCITEY